MLLLECMFISSAVARATRQQASIQPCQVCLAGGIPGLIFKLLTDEVEGFHVQVRSRFVERFSMGAPFSGGEIQGPAFNDMAEKVSWVEKFVQVGTAAAEAARDEHDRCEVCPLRLPACIPACYPVVTGLLCSTYFMSAKGQGTDEQWSLGSSRW